MYWICIFVIIFFIVFMLGYLINGFIEGDFNYENWSEDDRGNLVLGCISISILVMLLYGVSL